MSFVHKDSDFDDLLEIVSQKRHLSRGLVEKDYWITHSLWALHQTGLEIWFKGGTSLSKGFGLIERFSEDLDLKIEPGIVTTIPPVTNWKSEGMKATKQREAFFTALADTVKIPDATVSVDLTFDDPTRRNVRFQVVYPGRFQADLQGVLNPFVALEVGSARVTPFVERDMSAFVHDELVTLGQAGDFDDNRPKHVRCVHPLVSLLEKLDAIHRRAPRLDIDPASFVRHYEDAARVIRTEASLPPLDDYTGVRQLAEDMLAQKQLACLPGAADPAFVLDPGERTKEIGRAHAAIGQMFWGDRISLDEACEAIRGWVGRTL